MTDTKEDMAPAPELHLYQLKYTNGMGEKIAGTSAEAVKQERMAFWGDFVLLSIEEISG